MVVMKRGMGKFDDVHRRSLDDPTGFWGEAGRAIHWDRQPERVLDVSAAPFYRWFVGGQLNTCFNALDRWVDGGDGIDRIRAEQIALIHDSPVTGTVARQTYRELRDTVALFAGALRRVGVEAGDRVVIYM